FTRPCGDRAPAPRRHAITAGLLVWAAAQSGYRASRQGADRGLTHGGTPATHLDTGTAVVNDTHLFYEAAGRGPVVVLLHGGNLDRRTWDPQFLPLAQEHRVIRYDLRGY